MWEGEGAGQEIQFGHMIRLWIRGWTLVIFQERRRRPIYELRGEAGSDKVPYAAQADLG